MRLCGAQAANAPLSWMPHVVASFAALSFSARVFFSGATLGERGHGQADEALQGVERPALARQ